MNQSTSLEVKTGKNTVHFLNQVDEADLLALTEGKEPQTQPAVCTCAEKCEASSVKMDCEVCKNDRSGCVGKEPAAEEPKEEPKEKGGLNPALILLPLLLIGGGGAFYYFKFIKDKSSTKGNDDLGEYDFEDEYEKSFIADCSICFDILACFLWENETGRQRKTEYNCNAFSAIRFCPRNSQG